MCINKKRAHHTSPRLSKEAMWPTHLALLPREAGPTTADIRLKSYQQAKYVKELWLFLTAVIGLLAIFNWSSRLLLYACKLKWASGVGVVSHGKRSPEALKPGGTGRVSLRRVPDAIGSLFRVIAFRTTTNAPTFGPTFQRSLRRAPAPNHA